MGFSLWWFAPPLLISLGVVSAAITVGSISRLSRGKKSVGICGIFFSIILFVGAVRGIVFNHMSGRGCPSLEGHDAVIYGGGLLICGIIVLLVLFYLF